MRIHLHGIAHIPMSSSRDHHRKRERSPDTKSSRSDRDHDRDRGDRDKGRDSRHSHSTSSSSHKRRETSPRRERSSRRSDSEREDDGHSRKHKKSSSSGKDRDRDRERDRDRDSKKSSRHHEKSRSGKRSSRDESSSGSDSGSESGSGSSSEEDELIKKAKSMIQTISEDDYFTRSAEFRLWLRTARKKYFEDLTADEARRYFKKFVKAWNNFQLDESYYKGVRSSQLSSKGTTKYQWGFAKKIGRDDQSRVDSVRDSIDTMTNTRFANEVSRLTGKSTAAAVSSSIAPGPSFPRRALGPSMPPSRGPMTADEVADKEDRDQFNRVRHRAEQKALRKSKEADLEELAPKATGREAMLEKRRVQTAYHRRERSPDVELPEQDLMGTGDDFKSRLAAEKRRKELWEERRQMGSASNGGGTSGGVASVREAKQVAYKEKEEKQLEAFRQLWAQTQANKGGAL